MRDSEQRDLSRRSSPRCSTASPSASNDLTQLILGVDRDSDLVAHLFDERNDGRHSDDR